VLIKKLLNKKGLKFNYTYDFGDSWEHIILIEDIQEKKPNEKLTPVCIEGKNACPPEDCGGIGDYEDILKIRKNKKHPQYKEMIVGWLGEDFDPEKFDIKKVNGRLQKC
ncbi:MAG: plasmid pRiA4b ORF-3 family protein, partial [Candidatus Pacearchaeota archaeon]|nr:plasmid pRiA4b ORF-3 family protein [Candidatus Pacearchaeota archaeon]